MFKIQYMFYAVFIAILLTGCADTTTTERDAGKDEQANEDQFVQPIHYEGTRNQKVSEKDAEKQTDAPSLDTFDRDESAAFQKMISENVDVEDVQVVTANDRIVVAVQMKKGTNQRDFEEISEEIEQILDTDKQLFIYNNVAKWERVKDFYARDEANQMGEDMERVFENLFE
ncbi:YhcN/YlaJ family sporulation lipoprotein [Oceanobacillus sp. FSL W7-1293]|uniref:YhcN/YlaJ family sporulation lipoprotein n=1 Tax=Oceanobacillus TaxID=182709 RepID=UPI0030D5F878